MSQKRIVLPEVDNYRVVAISDVHGHKTHLMTLIEKVNLQPEDYLVFVGDLMNRGIDSYELYKYIQMYLKRPKTYILKGNHEFYIHHHLEEKKLAAGLFEFVQAGEYENILSSICKHHEMPIHHFKTVEDFQNYFKSKHSDVLTFMEERPIVLEIDGFRFVHGGYEAHFDLENEEGRFLKYDFYNEKTSPQPMTTIVGHWPACNLRKNCIDNRPFLNEEKHLVFIDGGLGVKSTGELNAFIIEKRNGQVTYQCESVNHFKTILVQNEASMTLPCEESVYINYPDYEVELIDSGEHWSVCRHKATQKNCSIPNSLIQFTEKGIELKMSYCNRFFNLEVGQTVELCLQEPQFSLVKYEGEFGWILNEQL